MISSICLLLIFFSGCHKITEEKIEPKISFSVSKSKLKKLPPTFSELSESEKKEEWGKEYFIGKKLAQNLDFYRAITAFKRADILIPSYLLQRKLEIQYFILLSYYYGEKYFDVIDSFQESELIKSDEKFSAYRNLLIILHESYYHTKHYEKAHFLLGLIEEQDQPLSQVIKVSHAIQGYDHSNLDRLNHESEIGKDTKTMVLSYEKDKKSVAKAQFYNAILPGAGYLYLGQKQAATTAFLLNGLTTFASYYFFKNDNIPAGVIMASIEAGWYFGGITGAKESAKLYNERIYENRAQPILQKHELLPSISINRSF